MWKKRGQIRVSNSPESLEFCLDSSDVGSSKEIESTK